MECPHLNKDTLEDGSTLICTDCGLVLDEIVLSTVDFVETPPTITSVGKGPLIATKIHQKSYNERNRERLVAFLNQLSTHFGWSGENESIMSLFDEIINHQQTDYGRGGDRTVGSLYLLKGRQHGLPITLNRLAEFMGDQSSALGRECMKLMSRHPQLAYTLHSQRFYELHISHVDSVRSEEERRRVQQLFHQLYQLLQKNGIDQGRFPEPLSVAILSICVDSLHPNNASILNSLCTKIGVSYRTAYKRYTEIKKFLLSLANQRLPWGDQVRNGNVLEYVEDILRVEQVTVEQYRPPAFVKAERGNEERRALIQRVSNRQNSSVYDNPEEFIVEYLISIGYTEEDIMAIPKLSFDLIL